MKLFNFCKKPSSPTFLRFFSYLDEAIPGPVGQDVVSSAASLAKIWLHKIDSEEAAREFSNSFLSYIERIDKMCRSCEYTEGSKAFVKARKWILGIKKRMDSKRLSGKDLQEIDNNMDWVKTTIDQVGSLSFLCCKNCGKIDPELENKLLTKINNKE